LSVGLFQMRLGRNRAVRESNALVARTPGPFKNLLKQILVKSFQMRGVKVALGAKPEVDCDATRNDVIRLKTLKLSMACRSDIVLDGNAIRERVIRHALQAMIKGFDARQNLVKFDHAPDEGRKNRLALRGA
jgi:hypothetical protein